MCNTLKITRENVLLTQSLYFSFPTVSSMIFHIIIIYIFALIQCTNSIIDLNIIENNLSDMIVKAEISEKSHGIL